MTIEATYQRVYADVFARETQGHSTPHGIPAPLYGKAHGAATRAAKAATTPPYDRMSGLTAAQLDELRTWEERHGLAEPAASATLAPNGTARRPSASATRQSASAADDNEARKRKLKTRLTSLGLPTKWVEHLDPERLQEFLDLSDSELERIVSNRGEDDERPDDDEAAAMAASARAYVATLFGAPSDPPTITMPVAAPFFPVPVERPAPTPAAPARRGPLREPSPHPGGRSDRHSR